VYNDVCKNVKEQQQNYCYTRASPLLRTVGVWWVDDGKNEKKKVVSARAMVFWLAHHGSSPVVVAQPKHFTLPLGFPRSPPRLGVTCWCPVVIAGAIIAVVVIAIAVAAVVVACQQQ
jgi:hypothetical protein